MKLNISCFNDVLVTIEKSFVVKYDDNDMCKIEYPEGCIDLEFLQKRLPAYSKEDIFYSVANLYQAKFIVAETLKACGEIADYVIGDITYEGHKYLQTI